MSLLPNAGELAYDDVLAAWRTYLANDNHGRGFVLWGRAKRLLIVAACLLKQGASRDASRPSLALSSMTQGVRWRFV